MSGATQLECSECGRKSDYLEFLTEHGCPKCETPLEELEDLI